MEHDAVVDDALHELVHVEVLASLLSCAGWLVRGFAEAVQRHLDTPVVQVADGRLRDLTGDAVVFGGKITDDGVALLGDVLEVHVRRH